MTLRQGEDFWPNGIVGDTKCLEPFNECEAVNKHTLKNSNEPEVVIQMIEEIEPDFIVSVQYPWILPAAVLDLAPNNAFNIHNAKLPDYRGHNALTYEILNQENFHISTLHMMDKEVDRGQFIKSEQIEIKQQDTAFSLWQRSIISCLDLFRWLVIEKNYLSTRDLATPILGLGNYYGKYQINKDKEIPEGSEIKTIERFARAFYFPPHEPAYFRSGNTKIYISPDFVSTDKKTNS